MTNLKQFFLSLRSIKNVDTPQSRWLLRSWGKVLSFVRRGWLPLFDRLVILVVSAALLTATGCRKEYAGDALPAAAGSDRLALADSLLLNGIANNPPQVNAGRGQRLVYPASSVTLSGTASDKEGTVSLLWTQAGGNSVAAIAQPASLTTEVSGLKPGVYTFVLSATDSRSMVRRDTTFVTVLQKMTWVVDGVRREALVHPPTGGTGSPALIFAFHGHGGTSLGFAQRGFEMSWPEAVVVYPQGLPTAGHNDRGADNTGWQHTLGEVNSTTGVENQDIKFFDAMLATCQQEFNINESLVFAHGWSNGGNFVYDVLWAARAEKLAGLAPASAVVNTVSGRKPLPVIHAAGMSDPKAKFSKQQAGVSLVRTLDKCAAGGTNWATKGNVYQATRYASSINDPVVFVQYDGGHAYPFTIPPLIVRFFKEVAGVK